MKRLLFLLLIQGNRIECSDLNKSSITPAQESIIDTYTKLLDLKTLNFPYVTPSEKQKITKEKTDIIIGQEQFDIIDLYIKVLDVKRVETLLKNVTKLRL